MLPKLLKSVIKHIQPSETEKAAEQKFASGIVARVEKAAPASARVMLAGSVAKGTYLRDSRDLDVFVLFKGNVRKSAFESLLRRVMGKAFPATGYQLSYAEHPYARFHFGNRRIDLVPAYEISSASERMSAVDRSVLHTKYVLANLGKMQADEVLLLKQLLRANSLYGAEIKTEGFSGYLCELLVIRYGSFKGVLSAAAKLKLPAMIDIKGHYTSAVKKTKKDTDAIAKRFTSGFVVIDPVDRDRNVAAALSGENLRRFQSLSRRFLKHPSEAYFFRKPGTFEQKMAALSKKGRPHTVAFARPDAIDDILWGQLKKLMRQLGARLEKYGFGLCRPGMLADDSDGRVRIAFAVKKEPLPARVLVRGPPVGMKQHAISFRQHHKGARFMRKKQHIFALVKRDIRTVEAALKLFFAGLRRSGSCQLFRNARNAIDKNKPF